MVKIGLIVPVYKNFVGFTELMQSVDVPVLPIVIPNWQHNTGVSAGWNEGIRQAIEKRCDVAIIANDDIVLAPGTIHKLVTGVWHEGYDLVTPANTRDATLATEPAYAESADFSCFMIEPESFLSKFGRFDENFFPAYFEDNDMAYRMRLSGGTYRCRVDAGMHHKGSVTQNWEGYQVVSGSMFECNRAYYVNKWGGVPGHEAYTNPYNDPNREISVW